MDGVGYEFFVGECEVCLERKVNIILFFLFGWILFLMKLGYSRFFIDKDIWLFDSWDIIE